MNQISRQRVVIALGGNAIQNNGEKGTYDEQMRHVNDTMAGILDALLKRNWEAVVTHGNGPQVGNILIQNALAKTAVAEMPMFVCSAMSQGQLGYLIQQSLKNLLIQRGQKREVATIITQVIVDPRDPAFQKPSKPVGPFYSEVQANEIARETGFVLKQDAGRGYRRVVSSPEPCSITEIEAIKKLLEAGIITVVCGGGGIPVLCENGIYRGADAVIDKDKTAALLADMLDADLLVILTAVDKVLLHFGKPNAAKIDTMSLGEAKQYLKEGHFAEGSMKPKIEAAISFLEHNPKRQVLITHYHVLEEALEGRDGTWIKS